MKHPTPILILLLLTFTSLMVRLWGIGDAPFWINEADNSRQLLFDTPRDKIAWTVAGAGFYLGDILIREFVIFFIPSEILHNSEAGLRIPSAFACAISVPLVHNLSSRFCDDKMAMLVTISWAFNPFAVDLSQQVSTYGMWPLWSTFLLIATFRLTSSMKINQTNTVDWIFFHSAMFFAITSNLFVLMIAFAVSPHVLYTVIAQYHEREKKIRALLSAYGPHLVPALIFIYMTLKPALDPTVNDNSWMPSANWSAPMDLMGILFPKPEKLGVYIMTILLIFGATKNLKINVENGINHLFKSEYFALLSAGTLQLICFLTLQLMGSPSWSTRYMLHLVPIWLILVAACISPKSQINSKKSKVKFYSYSNVGKALFLVIIISTISTTGPATDMRGHDTRGAWELVSEDYNEEEVQVVMTQPSEYFYTFYLELLEIEPDLFIGSWDDFTDQEFVEYMSIKPESVHRVRLEGYDDTKLSGQLSEEYLLARESFAKGMVVQHWIKIDGGENDAI